MDQDRLHPALQPIELTPEIYEHAFNELQRVRIQNAPIPPPIEEIAWPRVMDANTLNFAYHRRIMCNLCTVDILVGQSYQLAKNLNPYNPLQYVHTKCAEISFMCGNCMEVHSIAQKADQTWGRDDADVGNYVREVCIRCNQRYGRQCINCQTRVNRDGGGYWYDRGRDMIIENFSCFSCVRECYRCGYYLLMREFDRGADTCRYCVLYRNIIRSHDFNPMEVLTFRGEPKNGLYYGVELEVETTEGQNTVQAQKIIEACNDFAVIKHDGSLVNGFEVVTCPASLEEHMSFWDKYFDLDLKLESYNSPRCGMHVHMSRDAITPMHLARMMVFMYSANNRPLIEQIAGRNLHAGWGQRYAEVTSAKKITDIAGVLGGPVDSRNRGGAWEMFINDYGERDERRVSRNPLPPNQRKIYKKNTNRFGRYTALNDTNDRTIEVRIFRGCNRKSSIFKNLEFCQAMVDYCRPGQTSFSHLQDMWHFGKFVKNRKFEYRYLFAFMSKHKLIR